ncbi:hypothetical protein WH52_01355 [Tenacibaculum holothuriorum]|uniref:Uncharacterized protein n=1 Tax=Tenacibaculum holothuriorum TaxID=1635173 RepID=A0A1Y2PFQ7_9FLAO|nr:hypothetical protein [Tenacibaculum holothuriorum]OSY89314.1 hypothetical protein WH52_01355 [Tenacibaculum holothuriorum]
MEKISLNGESQLTHQIEKHHQAGAIVVLNASVDAKVKVELNPAEDSTRKTIPKIGLVLAVEAQNKIDALLSMAGTSMPKKQFFLGTANDTSDPAVAKTVIKQATLDIAWGGELALAEKDTVDVTLSDLEKIADSSVLTLESRKTSVAPYVIQEHVFEGKHSTLKVSLANKDVLFFDKAKLPNKITLIENGQRVDYSAERLLLEQIDTFGCIGYDENGKPIEGTYKAVVLPVSKATEVTFEDETDNRGDYRYYSIELPRA